MLEIRSHLLSYSQQQKFWPVLRDPPESGLLPHSEAYRCVLQQSTSAPDTRRPLGSVQPPQSQTLPPSPEFELPSERPVPVRPELDLSLNCSWMWVGLRSHKASGSSWCCWMSEGLTGDDGGRTPLYSGVGRWRGGSGRDGRPAMRPETGPRPDTGSESEAWNRLNKDNKTFLFSCQMFQIQGWTRTSGLTGF